MRKHLLNFEGSKGEVDSAQAKSEVGNNMIQLMNSRRAVKEKVILLYLLSRPEFNDVDKSMAYDWIKKYKKGDCEELVNLTIELTELETQVENELVQDIRTMQTRQTIERMLYDRLKNAVKAYKNDAKPDATRTKWYDTISFLVISWYTHAYNVVHARQIPDLSSEHILIFVLYTNFDLLAWVFQMRKPFQLVEAASKHHYLSLFTKLADAGSYLGRINIGVSCT